MPTRQSGGTLFQTWEQCVDGPPLLSLFPRVRSFSHSIPHSSEAQLVATELLGHIESYLWVELCSGGLAHGTG